MAKDFQNSIDNGYMVSTSIVVGDATPTDIRCVCDTVADFQTFFESTEFEIRYEGLVTYEKENRRLMVYDGTQWNEVGGAVEGLENYVTLERVQELIQEEVSAQIKEKTGIYVGCDEPTDDQYLCWIKTPLPKDGLVYPIDGHTHAYFFDGSPDFSMNEYPNKGYEENPKTIGFTIGDFKNKCLSFRGGQGISMNTTKTLDNGYTVHMVLNPKSSLNTTVDNTYFRFMKQANEGRTWFGINVLADPGGWIKIDNGKEDRLSLKVSGSDRTCLSLVVTDEKIRSYVNGVFMGEIDSYDFEKMGHDTTLMTIGYQFAEIDQINRRFAIMDFYSFLLTENILTDLEVQQVSQYLLVTAEENQEDYSFFIKKDGAWNEITTTKEDGDESKKETCRSYDVSLEDEANLYESNNVEEALLEVKLQANENEKRMKKTPDRLILADENGKEYRITVNTSGELKAEPTFVTPPPGFPEIIFEGESPYRGEFLVGIHAQQYSGKHFVFALNHKGHLLRYKEVPDYAIDFKKTVTKSGKVRYTYQQRIDPGDSWGHVEGLGYNFAKFTVLDEDWEIIDEVTLKAYGNIPEGHPVDCHESLIIDDGHYILTAYHSRIIPNYNADGSEAKIIQGVVQEIKDGEVVFHWESGDHLNTLADSYQDNNYTSSSYQEYFHLNAVWIDHRDDNLVISARNLNALYKLNRKSGEIMWILGGKRDMFRITEAQKFSRQHAPVILQDGTLLIFNNGNDKRYTSIMEFKIDENKKLITKFKEHKWRKDDGTVNLSAAMGNVNKLFLDKNIYAICWGFGRTASDYYWCEEIDFDKEISLCRFKPNNGHDIYRVHRYLD